MQHMPDKEFDRLFKDRFNDAEIEPSVNLWATIERELEPKRKRTIPIFWMAAAAVTLAISAMLVFQKKEVIELRGGDTLANTTVVQPELRATGAERSTPVQTIQVAQTKTEIRMSKVQDQQAIAVLKTSAYEVKKDEIALQPNTSNDRLPIKTMQPKPLDVEPIRETAVVETAPVLASVPVNDKMEDVISENSTERKGIRNVGDLVNYVVDKVDKRDKKLVKFSTDDDDNSSIVGINIGFLKFNKKNKN
jgi:hypothetical protein